jgi:hypothetical protein
VSPANRRSSTMRRTSLPSPSVIEKVTSAGSERSKPTIELSR